MDVVFFRKRQHPERGAYWLGCLPSGERILVPLFPGRGTARVLVDLGAGPGWFVATAREEALFWASFPNDE